MTSLIIEPASDGTANPSPLQRLGGRAGLDALIGALYFNILRDDRLARAFSGVDIGAVMSRQRDFFTIVLGADGTCSGRRLRAAHRRLLEEQGLDPRHFDALIDILAMTLDDLGHRGELARSIIGRFTALGDDVLDCG
jgi:hemoglobin